MRTVWKGEMAKLPHMVSRIPKNGIKEFRIERSFLFLDSTYIKIVSWELLCLSVIFTRPIIHLLFPESSQSGSRLRPITSNPVLQQLVDPWTFHGTSFWMLWRNRQLSGELGVQYSPRLENTLASLKQFSETNSGSSVTTHGKPSFDFDKLGDEDGKLTRTFISLAKSQVIYYKDT